MKVKIDKASDWNWSEERDLDADGILALIEEFKSEIVVGRKADGYSVTIYDGYLE